MKLDPTALDAAKRAFEDTRNSQPYPSMAWKGEEAVADNDRMDTDAFAAAIIAYLTALAESAHAAADPVDTTEFELAVAALIESVADWDAACEQSEKVGMDLCEAAYDAAWQDLINLYVKASAR